MVSRPARGTNFRFTASSVIRRTVQRAWPSGGSLQTIATIPCFSGVLSRGAAPGFDFSYSARSRPPSSYRWAIVRTALAVSFFKKRAISGAVTPSDR